MRNLLSAIAIIAFGLFLAVMIGSSKPAPDQKTTSTPESLSVRAMSAIPETIAVSVTSHGLLEASQSIDVTAEVSGTIIHAEKNFISGGAFAQKKTLLRIDDTDYQVALALAQADLIKSYELVATERARSEQARKEWRDLGSEDANNLFLRKPQLASAQAVEKAALARVHQAQANLKKTRITLPFASHVVETYVQQGQFISRGNKLAHVYAQGKWQVTLPLSQAQLKLLNLHWPIKTSASPIQVTLKAEVGNSQLAWETEVLHGSAHIDRKNQLAHIIVRVDDRHKSALPGLYVEATITGNKQEGLLLIPEDAFHDKRFVLIANKGKLEFRAATFLGRQGENLIVKTDIQSGELIIIDRLPLATPGMSIAPQLITATDTGAL